MRHLTKLFSYALFFCRIIHGTHSKHFLTLFWSIHKTCDLDFTQNFMLTVFQRERKYFFLYISDVVGVLSHMLFFYCVIHDTFSRYLWKLFRSICKMCHLDFTENSSKNSWQRYSRRKTQLFSLHVFDKMFFVFLRILQCVAERVIYKSDIAILKFRYFYPTQLSFSWQ